MLGYIQFADRLSAWFGKAFAWCILIMRMAFGFTGPTFTIRRNCWFKRANTEDIPSEAFRMENSAVGTAIIFRSGWLSRRMADAPFEMAMA